MKLHITKFGIRINCMEYDNPKLFVIYNYINKVNYSKIILYIKKGRKTKKVNNFRFKII